MSENPYQVTAVAHDSESELLSGRRLLPAVLVGLVVGVFFALIMVVFQLSLLILLVGRSDWWVENSAVLAAAGLVIPASSLGVGLLTGVASGRRIQRALQHRIQHQQRRRQLARDLDQTRQRLAERRQTDSGSPHAAGPRSSQLKTKPDPD